MPGFFLDYFFPIASARSVRNRGSDCGFRRGNSSTPTYIYQPRIISSPSIDSRATVGLIETTLTPGLCGGTPVLPDSFGNHISGICRLCVQPRSSSAAFLAAAASGKTVSDCWYLDSCSLVNNIWFAGQRALCCSQYN